jgi:hypothetical protein
MVKIPFLDYPCFSEDVLLDGTPYTLEFAWNARGEFWTVSFYDSGKTLIVAGIKLVLAYDLLEGRHHLALPDGGLYVVDTADDMTKIGYQDFVNNRALMLVYFTETENASI